MYSAIALRRMQREEEDFIETAPLLDSYVSRGVSGWKVCQIASGNTIQAALFILFQVLNAQELSSGNPNWTRVATYQITSGVFLRLPVDLLLETFSSNRPRFIEMLNIFLQTYGIVGFFALYNAFLNVQGFKSQAILSYFRELFIGYLAAGNIRALLKQSINPANRLDEIGRKVVNPLLLCPEYTNKKAQLVKYGLKSLSGISLIVVSRFLKDPALQEFCKDWGEVWALEIAGFFLMDAVLNVAKELERENGHHPMLDRLHLGKALTPMRVKMIRWTSGIMQRLAGVISLAVLPNLRFNSSIICAALGLISGTKKRQDLEKFQTHTLSDARRLHIPLEVLDEDNLPTGRLTTAAKVLRYSSYFFLLAFTLTLGTGIAAASEDQKEGLIVMLTTVITTSLISEGVLQFFTPERSARFLGELKYRLFHDSTLLTLSYVANRASGVFNAGTFDSSSGLGRLLQVVALSFYVLNVVTEIIRGGREELQETTPNMVNLATIQEIVAGATGNVI